MRSILPVSFLLLAACSEYNIVQQKDEPSMPDTSNEADGMEPEVTTEEVDETTSTETTVVVEEPAEEEADNESVDPNECSGFLIEQLYDNPDIETESYGIFSLVGDSEVEVRQGETAKFQLAVTAHNCGDIVLTGLTVTQSVIDYTPASWVTDVEHSGETSMITNTSGEAQFSPIDGYNCNSDDYDSQIFYTWRTEVQNANTQGAMDEVYIEAATTQIFEFSFTATEYIEPGTSFDLYLIDPEWTDVGTGAEVWDSLYYLPSWDDNHVSVRITITE